MVYPSIDNASVVKLSSLPRIRQQKDNTISFTVVLNSLLPHSSYSNCFLISSLRIACVIPVIF